MAMYERFDIPAGVYLLDRPYPVGSEDPDSEGFHSFEWDSARLPNIDATGLGYLVLVLGYLPILDGADHHHRPGGTGDFSAFYP